MEGGEYLSVDDVGKVLGVSPRTVRRWCLKGRLRGHAQMSGKSYSIDRDAVEELRQKLAAGGDGEEKADEGDTDVRLNPVDDQSAEAAEDDTSANGQEVDSVAEQEEDAGQTDGLQEKMADLCGQVEKLRARIDRVGQILSDRSKKLEKGYSKLSVTVENLKGWLVLMSVVLVLEAVIVALAFYGHHVRYAHVWEWKHNLQQAQEKEEKEAVEEKLGKLEQAVKELKSNRVSADRIIEAPVQSMAATGELVELRADVRQLRQEVQVIDADNVRLISQSNKKHTTEVDGGQKAIRIHELFQAVIKGEVELDGK